VGGSTANFDLGAENLAAVPSHRRHIADRLRAAIIAGTMEAGPVYSAPALAAQFGVSPTPVREAMIDLAKDGLVEVLRYKGFRVTEPSEKELRDMLEVRLLLEVPTVERVAAQAIDAETVARLHELAAQTVERAESRDVLGHLAADLQFHLELLSLAGNQEIVETVRVLRSRTRLYGLHSDEHHDVLLHSAREHGELVGLTAAGESRKAAELIRRHISDIRQQWSKESST
jgi:DNA-binding GntR family transcriptional regulator